MTEFCLVASTIKVRTICSKQHTFNYQISQILEITCSFREIVPQISASLFTNKKRLSFTLLSY